ncbi:TlpA disulfide reductase family protein [Emticicia fluvialis]|uniref:TlpA disulfide reductase family protein n=1 Tax=Emticicia fluvialis TaxID=2974474 RepID=UPI002165BF81|nr:TlpA disulfide reductase family protein [Emticicia fluvialis]
MKTFCLVSLIILFPVVSLSQSFQLNGKIDNCHNRWVYIEEVNKNTKSDSALCKSNQFSLTGSISEPKLVRLTVNGSDSWVDFFLEKGTINITTQKDSLWKISFTNSPLNQLYQNFNTHSANPIRMKLVEFSIKKNNLIQPQDSVQITLVNNAIDSLYNQSVKNIISFIEENNDSFLSLYYLEYQYGAIGIPKSIQLFSALREDIRITPTGQRLIEKLNKIGILQINDQAPAFVLKDMQGKELSLSQLAGKKVLLNFWASWCGPCRKEHPELVKIYERLKSKNIEFISISTDEDITNWKEAVKKDKLHWPQLIDKKDTKGLTIANKYGIYGIPANIIIDENGKVIAKDINLKDIDKFLN